METNVLFNPAYSVENFRARVNRLTSGEIVITPIKEGSRGPLYSEPLVMTIHGRFTKSTRNWHVAFDVDVKYDMKVVADCLEKEIKEIIDYIRTNQQSEIENI